ncbi:alpha/beta hydrolase [Phenylobacterium sp.]|uniref:alpha/beta fold hydrolase n=1 Tax=Phenylobacterium sp. TaxID=1871053 RepID=UPI002EDA0486
MRTRVTVSPGVELDVIQSGDPTGVPLLLLHGLSDSNASMRVLMDELPKGVRAIAITQRGHGDSSKPAGPYTTDAFVADVAAVMDRLSVRRAVVFGHSMGSVVAQRFALKHPDRVAGLVLEGAFPGLKGNPAVAAFYEGEIRTLGDPIDPTFAREFQVSTIVRPVPEAFIDLVSSESQKLPARAWKQILQDMMQIDTTADLARLKVPALLLWGDRDTFVLRSDQDRLAAAIADSTLEVFEGTGHDPHWEEPSRVANLVADFVQRHAAPVPAR